MAQTAGFKRALDSISRAVRDSVQAEIVPIAEDVAATMRRVGPRDQTFQLERSICVERDATRPRVYIKAGGRLTTRAVSKGVAATYDYALAQEFGTAEMQANPFFYPTWRLKRRKARAAVTRAIKRVVRAAAAQNGLTSNG